MNATRNFLFTIVIAMFAVAVNLSAQARVYDFDAAGKPVQVGGPNFTEVAPQPAPASQPGQPQDQSGQPPAAQPQPGQPAPAPVAKPAESFTNRNLVIAGGLIILLLLIGIIVWARRGARTTEDENEQQLIQPVNHSVRVAHAPAPVSAAPATSPATPVVRRAGPPANLVAPAPASAPQAAPPAAPVAPQSGAGNVAPVVIGFLLLSAMFSGSSQAAEAPDVHVYPGAVAPGHSVNGSLVANFDLTGLVGCSVALPQTGCSVVRGTVNGKTAMITLTAAPTAMGGALEPIIGNINLTFSGKPSQVFHKAVGLARTEQIGTLELQHLMAPSSAPQVINRTVYQTDPGTKREVAKLRGEWDQFRSQYQPTQQQFPQQMQQPAPPVNTPPPPPAFNAGQTAPVASAPPATVGGNELAQAVGKIQSQLNGMDNRLGGLVTQVNNLQTNVTQIQEDNKKFSNILGVLGARMIADGKDNRDRCRRADDFIAAGGKITNPEAAGCKVKK